MIGEQLYSAERTYTITKELSVDRHHANIYLCEDGEGIKYAAKHFFNGSCQPSVGFAVHNHYGRRRDGSRAVFNEIHEKCKTHNFLVNHIERIRHKGKWVIILEYVEGEALRSYLLQQSDPEHTNVTQAVKTLAETLSLWHQHGFALGDAHLDNAMVHFEEQGRCSVKLIDYSLLHHKDFFYCNKFNRFTPDPQKRIQEDLENDFTNLGAGFRYDIMDVQKKKAWNNQLLETFDRHYVFPG